ncbi:hypothetical protein PCL_05398 [Purpureocillium lilacinum]|uniref:Uncharacterized protein n=1 Tax=Purpureocillium lilacinum TaxID=33203 RepID=A0A2U3DV99_PURLI|nr:hypothetical protein PCL_05398 [Purpureocillium lilacinum]
MRRPDWLEAVQGITAAARDLRPGSRWLAGRDGVVPPSVLQTPLSRASPFPDSGEVTLVSSGCTDLGAPDNSPRRSFEVQTLKPTPRQHNSQFLTGGDAAATNLKAGLEAAGLEAASREGASRPADKASPPLTCCLRSHAAVSKCFLVQPAGVVPLRSTCCTSYAEIRPNVRLPAAVLEAGRTPRQHAKALAGLPHGVLLMCMVVLVERSRTVAEHKIGTHFSHGLCCGNGGWELLSAKCRSALILTSFAIDSNLVRTHKPYHQSMSFRSRSSPTAAQSAASHLQALLTTTSVIIAPIITQETTGSPHPTPKSYIRIRYPHKLRSSQSTHVSSKHHPSTRGTRRGLASNLANLGLAPSARAASYLSLLG